jgi:probable phosphoglycerate mutase
VNRIEQIENPFRKPADRVAVHREIEQLFTLDDESATELILVRHAEPARRDFSPGNDDPLLSCCGLDQAERLAERLGPLWVEAVYSAPERRALQTASILAEATHCEVVAIDELREIEFTAQKAGAPALDGTVTERFVASPRWDSIPGFASSETFRRRTLVALDSLVAAHPGERLVVVTHASVINAYLSAVLGIQRDVFFAPEHTSISWMHSLGELYAVRSLNDTAHLASPTARKR